MPLLLQSVSHSSGMPLPLQSWLAPERDVALVGNAVRVAVLTGPVRQVAVVRNAVVVAVRLALIGDSIAVAVLAGTRSDVALVRNTVRVAVLARAVRRGRSRPECRSLLQSVSHSSGMPFAIAVLARARGDVALVRNAVRVAVLAGPVRQCRSHPECRCCCSPSRTRPGMPLPLQSWLAPAKRCRTRPECRSSCSPDWSRSSRSQSSGMPLLLQSVSHSSGMPLPLQS